MVLESLSGIATGAAAGIIIGLAVEAMFPTRFMGPALGLLIGAAGGAALSNFRV